MLLAYSANEFYVTWNHNVVVIDQDEGFSARVEGSEPTWNVRIISRVEHGLESIAGVPTDDDPDSDDDGFVLTGQGPTRKPKKPKKAVPDGSQPMTKSQLDTFMRTGRCRRHPWPTTVEEAQALTALGELLVDLDTAGLGGELQGLFSASAEVATGQGVSDGASAHTALTSGKCEY